MNITELKTFAGEPLSFTTRESYLVWRAAWRAHYAQVSATIRGSRNETKNRMRAGEYAGEQQERTAFYSYYAGVLMARRVESKLRAQEQYLARKAEISSIAA